MLAFGEVNDVSRKSIEGGPPESHESCGPLLSVLQIFRSRGNLARGPGASVMIVIGGPLPMLGLCSSLLGRFFLGSWCGARRTRVSRDGAGHQQADPGQPEGKATEGKATPAPGSQSLLRAS